MENRTSWQIQKTVVHALYLREMKTRFGSQKWGYFWAVIEPAAFVAVFWVMFGFQMRTSLPGIDYPMFLMTGMIPWQLFSNIVTRSMNAFEANAGLFNYRQVKPIDALFARGIVESLVYMAVFLLFMGAGSLLGFDAAVENILGLCLVIGELICLAFSLGLIFAVVGTFSDNFKKVIGLILRPLFFSSGIFFAVEMVPEQFRWMLLLNPVLHFLELIRAHYFAAFYSPYADYLYIHCWTMGAAVISLWLYSQLQNRIIAT